MQASSARFLMQQQQKWKIQMTHRQSIKYQFTYIKPLQQAKKPHAPVNHNPTIAIPHTHKQQKSEPVKGSLFVYITD